MDAVTDERTSDVVIMSSAQIGKSEILLNVIGYFIEHQPAPILMVQPTLEMAEAFSKDRIAPMLRDTEVLTGLIADARSRDSGNTLLHKQFPGGHITLAGANSAASLASRPIRVVLADEVDRYPVSAGAEGDPLALAEKRTQTFWNRKKIKVSTPGVKDLSRIEAAYKESDQRHYFIPCPHCKEPQVLKWAQVHWDADLPQTAAYFCPHCGVKWTESERIRAIRDGSWRASTSFRGVAGFHISELYSPWSSLAKIAAEFLQAKDHPERLKTWVNTCLGEVWEETRDTKDPLVLRDRAEDYELGTLPAPALLVTMAVDVQGDRLEAYTWGYGRGEEAWCVDFREFYGDPARPLVWDQLLEHLDRPLQHALGAEITARTVAIDSGGLHTQEVYSFCRRHAVRDTPYGRQQVIAIKGQSQEGKAIIGRPTPQDIDIRGEKITRGVQLWPVGSSEAKRTIYARLSLEEPGPGFIHTSRWLPEGFWEQLISERLVTKYVRGFPKMEWHIPKGRRNEALDCAVYAYAAACQLGMPRMRESDWKFLTERSMRAAETPADTPVPPPAALPPAPTRLPGRTWVNSWRK
jgi:phage terminase large subunit GpA-like protein